MTEFMYVDVPFDNGSYCDKKSLLSSYDTKYVEGADYVVYHYRTGSYEGTGNALIKKDGKWYTASLGHCSCYGPLDDYKFEAGYENLGDIPMSKEYAKEIEPLIAKARELS